MTIQAEGEGGVFLFCGFFDRLLSSFVCEMQCSQGRAAAGGNRPSATAFCELGLSGDEELLQTI